MSRRWSVLVAPTLVLVATACADDGVGSADPLVAHGEQLSRTRGCAACHGTDGQGGLGPAWTDMMGTEVTFTDGSTATVDTAYLAESIREPAAEVVEGFTVKMPATQLTDDEVAALVAYITSLSA